MPRRPPHRRPSESDPISASVDALRRALGETEEDWDDDLKPLTPASRRKAAEAKNEGKKGDKEG